MKLRKRFIYFFLGFGLGIILVIFLFKGRGLEWLPSNRVLYAINESTIFISKYNNCLLKCKGINKDEIFNLLENGEVNFSNSKTKDPIKNYVIEHLDLKLTFSLDLKDSVSELINLTSINSCDCKDTSKVMVTLNMSNNMILSKLKLKAINQKDRFNCQVKCLNLSNKIIDLVFEKGKVLFEYSLPKLKPNPLYFIVIEIEKMNYLILVEEGATKIRFKNIELISKDKLTDKSTFTKRLKGLFNSDNCLCED